MEETRLHSQSKCRSGSIIGIDPTGTHIIIIPTLCKSWDCPECGPRKRSQWIARLASGKPQRMMTLTCTPDPNTTAREKAIKMKTAFIALIAEIRRRRGKCEYALVFEIQENGSPHMHVLMRGPYVPQKWIKAFWSAAGVGSIVDIRAAHSPIKEAGHACKYLAKETGQTAMRLAPLRIVQVSRRYELPTPERPARPQTVGYTWAYLRDDIDTIVKNILALDVQKTIGIDDEFGIEIQLQSDRHIFDISPPDDEQKFPRLIMDCPFKPIPGLPPLE